MPPSFRTRATYLLLALLAIVLGLWVHRGGGPFGAATRDMLGDALWAMMIAWGMGVLWPARGLAWRAAVALAICAAVELGQLVHTPALDAVRQTILGRLILGSDFDARDLLAYGGGVLAAAGLDRKVFGRSGADRSVTIVSRPDDGMSVM